ncbi:uncharacterized protein LOC126727686 [Quercus robur]|uniref:uncharacterized protein LOC126727686 n=1 Tax=Quercus robur TaxID=38942 RepID=UPI0021635850|nr:uncharacterized protein LOC126727686 [Quercus robur]
MDPIKYIFEKPAFTGKISCWQMLLFEFDIVFMTRKAIKGQAIANYLADQLLNDLELLESLFPDEDVVALEPEPDSVELWRWRLYFDGAANSTGNGVGVVLVSPKGKWQARYTKLILYQKCVSRLISKCVSCLIVDALATLANMVKLSEGDDMWQLRIEVRGIPTYCMNIEECMSVEVEANGKPWYHDIKAYIKDSEYLPSAIDSER